MSLSTVYRTLGLLKQLSLVDELHLWDEHHHYESAVSGNHCHLVCQACGNVIEDSGELVESLRAMVADRHGFRVEKAVIDFVGLCVDCLWKLREAPEP